MKKEERKEEISSRSPGGQESGEGDWVLDDLSIRNFIFEKRLDKRLEKKRSLSIVF